MGHSLPAQPRPGRIALLVGIAVTAAACGPAEQANDSAPVANATEEPAANVSAAPLVPSVMDRAALLEAVWRAAAAAGAGSDDSQVQRGLDGRPVEFTIRFGCAGPEEKLKSAPLGWSFTEADRTLRVRAAPTLTGASPEIRELLGEEIEAVEGFWIPRPWLLEPVCPRTAAIDPGRGEAAEPADQASPAVQPSGRVGIAQFFTEDDARTGRRDRRAFDSLKILEKGQPIGSQGFNLVLAGRLRALPGKRVINCIAANGDSPPDCVVSADLDRVRIEQPDTGEVVAEWSPT
jgi:hypothetical protein